MAGKRGSATEKATSCAKPYLKMSELTPAEQAVRRTKNREYYAKQRARIKQARAKVATPEQVDLVLKPSEFSARCAYFKCEHYGGEDFCCTYCFRKCEERCKNSPEKCGGSLLVRGRPRKE